MTSHPVENYSVAVPPEQNTNELKTYSKGPIPPGYNGQLYEKYLLIWSLAKRTLPIAPLTAFFLASNMDEAGAFDDIVLQYLNSDNEIKIIFLQAKHKDDVNKQKINLQLLFSKAKNDFSLVKYFESYQAIKLLFAKPDDGNDPIFSIPIDNCEFIIFTNATINEKNIKLEHLSNIKYNDSIFNFTNEFYRINEDNEDVQRCIQATFNGVDVKDTIRIRTEFIEFLKKFKLMVNQPNQEILHQNILNLIELTYPSAQMNYSNEIFSTINYEMETWWMELIPKQQYLTEKTDWFEKIAKFLVQFQFRDPSDTFTGRQDELDRIDDMLTDDVSSSKIVVISGLGGIGKTSLIRTYILQENNHLKNILWINADSDFLIMESFRQLAEVTLQMKRELDDKIVVQNVYAFFKYRKHIIVFDNAQSKCQIEQYLPQDPNIEILITSRNRNWDNYNFIDLQVLSVPDAFNFVQKVLKDSDESEIHELIETLGSLPLPLEQAIFYIKYTQKGNPLYKISDYVKYFNGFELESERFQNNLDMDYDETTLTTWLITITTIAADGECGQVAIDLLNILAYMEPNHISGDLLDDLVAAIKTCPDTIKLAENLLVAYSMINFHGNVHYHLSVHQIVQLITRMNLEDRQTEVIDTFLSTSDDYFQNMYVINEYCNISDIIEKFQSLPLSLVKGMSYTPNDKDFKVANKIISAYSDVHGNFSEKTLELKCYCSLALYSKNAIDQALTLLWHNSSGQPFLRVDMLIYCILINYTGYNELDDKEFIFDTRTIINTNLSDIRSRIQVAELFARSGHYEAALEYTQIVAEMEKKTIINFADGIVQGEGTAIDCIIDIHYFGNILLAYDKIIYILVSEEKFQEAINYLHAKNNYFHNCSEQDRFDDKLGHVALRYILQFMEHQRIHFEHLAVIYFQSGNYSDAIINYMELVEVDLLNQTGEEVDEAKEYYRNGRNSEALEIIRRLYSGVIKDPNYGGVLETITKYLYSLHEHEKIMNIYKSEIDKYKLYREVLKKH